MHDTDTSAHPADFGFGSSIPVIRMLDEAKARAFYIDFLEFEIEWEHRFNPVSPTSPLYMQVRLGDAVLHLNGHADENAPTTEVRIPTTRLDAFCSHLRTRGTGEEPCVVDARETGVPSDMNLLDPSGNLLVFWLVTRD